MWTYYNGKTVFITGSSGFLGTALVHRLLSATKCRRVYLLARGGRSGLLQRWGASLPPTTARWLLDHHRVSVLDGDMTQPQLGLMGDQAAMLHEEVNIVLHAASSINLVHTLLVACRNVTQTAQTVAQFGLQCHALERFVYVSTAYANAHLHSLSSQGEVHVDESIYPLGETRRSAFAEFEELLATGSSEEYESHDFPWAYGYAKHLSERLITAMFTDTGNYSKLLIVRPSIIGPAETLPFPGYVVPTSSPATVVAALLANTPATEIRFCSTMKDPEHNATFDEVPVDVVVDRLLVHLAQGTDGCINAVSGRRARTAVSELYQALCRIRWLPWRFRVVWSHEGWHSRSQHSVSRVFKVFGTNFAFSEARTVALQDGLDDRDKQGLYLFKTVNGQSFELVSRREQIDRCVLALSQRMGVIHRVLYRILWLF